MFEIKKYSIKLPNHLPSGEAVFIGGFIDANLDGSSEVYLATRRRNDGDIYKPSTQATLDPSPQYLFSPSSLNVTTLPKNLYDPLASFIDINNDGAKDLVLLDLGDESRTHYYQLYGETVSKIINAPSIGAQSAIFLTSKNSPIYSNDLSLAIEKFRLDNSSIYQPKIKNLSEYFGGSQSNIPNDVLQWTRPYNSITYDFNKDGFDDLFIENGSDGIGPNQFLYDGKSKSIDSNFTNVWRDAYTNLLKINFQRFSEYEVFSSKSGIVWIVAGTMREADSANPNEDASYMLKWQNVLMGFEKTPSGWVSVEKLILPLPNWANNFIKPTAIWVQKDDAGNPKEIYINHQNDQTNKFGTFVGNYLQALSIDLNKKIVSDITKTTFPYQKYPSAIFDENGKINKSGMPTGDFSQGFFDINNDGFVDLISTSYYAASKYHVPVWMNTGENQFLPATNLYLKTENNNNLRINAFHDIDKDGLLNFWSAGSTSQGADLFDYELSDFRIDPIFGSLPIESRQIGFNGAYVCKLLGIDPESINSQNAKYIFNNALIDLAKNKFLSFAPNATIHGYEDLNDFFQLREGNENAFGYAGNDTFSGLGGNDFLDGGAGIDTAVFTGAATRYTIVIGNSNSTVSDKTINRDGTDTITNVERLQFTDTMLALDTGKDQTAGSTYMLYKAAFNRTPDVGGLGFWINQMDKGMSYNDVAKNFVNSAEFKTAFGGSNPTVNTLVTKLYNNVLNRAPDAGGLAFWQEKLTTGWSTADVLGYFSTSAENVTNVTPLIANGIQYQQFVG